MSTNYRTNGHHKKEKVVLAENELLYDDEAERAVLGSLLIDPDAYGFVRPLVSLDDFYLQRHRWIYQELLTLIEEGETPDLLNMTDRMNRHERPDDFHWDGYLMGLINVVPTSMNAPSYAKIVNEYAVRRRMVLASLQIATHAHNMAKPLDESLAEAEAAALNLRGLRADAGVKSAKEIGLSFLNRLENIRESGVMPGLPSGFVDLDRLTDGFEAQPWLLASRPGMGKSALALCIALNVALRQNKRVMFFSLEMSENQLMSRAVASECRIPLSNVRRPRFLSDAQMEQVYEMSGRIGQAGLFVDATPGITASQIRAKALRKAMELGGLDLVIIDHLHIMGADVPGLTGTTLITHLSKEVMKLPKILGCPVLYLAQLNRNLEIRGDKHPNLSDLRDSGSLEEDAYGVLFIYREDYYNKDVSERPNVAEIIIAKNRDGSTGTCDLFWRGETTSFHSLQRNEVSL